MASVTRASVAGNVPTIITKGWILYRMPNLVMGSVINMDYAEGINIGDTIQLTTHTTRVAPTQVTTGLSGQGAEPSPVSVSFTQPSTSNVQLVIDQFWYGAIQLTQYAPHLAKGDIEKIFKDSVFDGLQVKIDATKANLANGFSNFSGTLGSNMGDEDFLSALNSFNTNNVPAGDRHFVISAEENTNLFRIEKYINKDYIDGNAVTQAEVGELYRMRVHVTTNLNVPAGGQHDCMAIQKDAVGSQLRVGITPIALMNPNSIANEITLFAIWGDKEMRDDHGFWLKGK